MLVTILPLDFEFEDSRGSLKQLIHDGFKQVNVITSKANVVRGGHCHAFNKEAFYVISGVLELKLSDGTISEIHKFSSGDFFMIEEKIFHDFLFIEDCILVSFYSNGVELLSGEKDIITM